MSRIVMVLQNTINGPSQVYLAEPSHHCQAGIPMPLRDEDLARVHDLVSRLNGPSEANPGIVKDIGESLLNMLSRHPAIEADVLPLLNIERQCQEPVYLFMKDRNPMLEQLPWEALYAPNVGFLSTNRDYPVIRTQQVAHRKYTGEFNPPLKMMAVMGASGNSPLTRVSAELEWESLYRAIISQKLAVKLRVLLCESELKEKIDKAKTKWISTELLRDRDQLFDEIDEFEPHLLHFFCHGTSKPVPQLHVASSKDWETDAQGSIRIEGSQLKQRANKKDKIWLVTLNCCESAQYGNDSGALSMPMASSLINSGFPVVIGMREQVADDFAHRFCGLFHKTLLEDFSRWFSGKKNKRASDMNWACALFAARQSICDITGKGQSVAEIAASNKEWTIPVIHTRLETFQLRLVDNKSRNSGNSRKHSGRIAAPRPKRASTSLTSKKRVGLSAKEIQRLNEEVLQLLEERRSFINLEVVVRVIDERLKHIEVLLKKNAR